jgi:hypothetical protein
LDDARHADGRPIPAAVIVAVIEEIQAVRATGGQDRGFPRLWTFTWFYIALTYLAA